MEIQIEKLQQSETEIKKAAENQDAFKQRNEELLSEIAELKVSLLKKC